MDNWKDLYSVLQVHPEAELEIIQSAYKRLCKKYHPDVNNAPLALEKMKNINSAYEILGNADSRKKYHVEWSRRNKQSAFQSSPRVEFRDRIVYVNRDRNPAYGGGTPQAYQVLYDYFRDLAKYKLKEAFALVSEEDKKRISFGSFVEWQESVTAIFEVGSFELKLFKRYEELRIDSVTKRRAEEYTVHITEKNKNTGKVVEYSITKYAIYENTGWKVYLGYRDLTPIVMQFKTMATSPEEAQIVGLWERYKERHDVFMGMPNKKGFEEKLELEVYRYKRHGRPFSLAVFQMSFPSKDSGGRHERIEKYAGYILSHSIRLIDSVSYIGEGQFGIVLPETDKKMAALALRRLLQAVRHDLAACFDYEIDICAGFTEYKGQNLDGLIVGCLKTIQASKKKNSLGQSS